MKIIKPLMLVGLLGILAYLTLSKQGKLLALSIGGGIMNISDKGIAFISNFEGFSDKPYNDPPGSRKWSIGYGHQILPGEILTSVTRDQAATLLAKDTAIANAAITENITVPLTQAQHYALVSFVYNVGVYAFKSGSVPSRINSGNFSDAAATMKKYIYAGGSVNQALVERRKSEASAFA